MRRLCLALLAAGLVTAVRVGAQFPEETVRAAVEALATASVADLGGW